MIMRVWQARATAQGAEAYRELFKTTVVPMLKKAAGLEKTYLLERTEGDVVHISVQTLWQSMDDIRNFAGPDLTKAVIEPKAAAVLSDYDSVVQHAEVLVF